MLIYPSTYMKMKKTVLIIAVALFSQLAFSQYPGTKRFTLAVSPTISWMKSDHEYVAKASSTAGYNFGVIMDSFFGENYAFTTGLLINTTGGKLKYGPTEIQETYKLKYIEIPLGLKLRSEDLRRINIYGRFGLSPQINIQAHNKSNKSISGEVRLFDLSYHLGGGVEYAINSKNAFMFGLLFNNGFTDVTKRDNFEDKTILNRLTFEFGFIF